jgi:hypothetical protein
MGYKGSTFHRIIPGFVSSSADLLLKPTRQGFFGSWSLCRIRMPVLPGYRLSPLQTCTGKCSKRIVSRPDLFLIPLTRCLKPWFILDLSLPDGSRGGLHKGRRVRIKLRQERREQLDSTRSLTKMLELQQDIMLTVALFVVITFPQSSRTNVGRVSSRLLCDFDLLQRLRSALRESRPVAILQVERATFSCTDA